MADLTGERLMRRQTLDALVRSELSRTSQELRDQQAQEFEIENARRLAVPFDPNDPKCYLGAGAPGGIVFNSDERSYRRARILDVQRQEREDEARAMGRGFPYRSNAQSHTDAEVQADRAAAWGAIGGYAVQKIVALDPDFFSEARALTRAVAEGEYNSALVRQQQIARELEAR